MAIRISQKQSRVAIMILYINISAFRDKQFSYLFMAIRSSLNQGREAIIIVCINISAFRDK